MSIGTDFTSGLQAGPQVGEFYSDQRSRAMLQMIAQIQQNAQNQKANQLQMMKQAQEQQYQQQVIAGEKEQRKQDLLKNVFSADTPAGASLRLQAAQPYLSPQEYQTGQAAVQQFGIKWQSEQDKATIDKAKLLGWTPGPSSPPPSTSMPPGYSPTANAPAGRTPSPQQGAPGQGGVSIGGQMMQPPSKLEGTLQQDVVAQRILQMGDAAPPADRAGAEAFYRKQEGGEFNLAIAATSHLKTPEEKQAFLQQNYPDTYNYLKGMAEGRIPVTGFSQYSNTIRAAEAAIFPETDWGYTVGRQVAWENYLNPNGKFQQNVISLNTLSSHLQELKSDISKLNPDQSPPSNWFDMTAKTLTGDPNVTAFSAPELAVKLETYKALAGSAITDQEMNSLNKVLGAKFFGRDQADQFVKSVARLAQQRLRVAQESVTTTLGPEAPKRIGILYPTTEQAFANILGKENAMGGAPRFDSEDAAKAAAANGTIKPGDKIMVGGRPATWQ